LSSRWTRGIRSSVGQIKPHGKDILELASIAVYPEHQGQGSRVRSSNILLKDSPRRLYLMCVPRWDRFTKSLDFGDPL
jgi:hypothetical protein